eukprot:6211463-Pleurochrysis_carterae.AAC.5
MVSFISASWIKRPFLFEEYRIPNKIGPYYPVNLLLRNLTGKPNARRFFTCAICEAQRTYMPSAGPRNEQTLGHAVRKIKHAASRREHLESRM